MSKKNSKPALGRGLGALIPGGFDGASESAPRVHVSVPELAGEGDRSPLAPPRPVTGSREISLDSISLNPKQVRTVFKAEALEELAASIRQVGLIQPITVRALEGGRYQLISGERRFQAARMAGLTTLPAYVKEVADEELLTLALVENIQREDLDAIETALAYQRLLEEASLTQEAMAERVGKKRATVANYLRLLKLPAPIQLLMRQELLSMGHAKALLGIEDQARQWALAERVAKEGLSVRRTEELARQEAAPKAPKKAAPGELPESYYRVLELIGQHFNNNISIKRNAQGKGSMTIHFSSDREMEQFLATLDKNHEM